MTVRRNLRDSDKPALPDPCDVGLYVRYVETCSRAGVEPLSPARVRELISGWNGAARGEPVVSSALRR
jgi:hypothetical protein